MATPRTQPPFWEISGLPAPGAALSLAAYEALPETSVQMEWHAGIVRYPNWNEETMSPAPTLRHQQVVMRGIQLLLAHIPNGEVFTAPTDVRLGDRIVQPDVFWVAEGSACVPRTRFFAGGPDLIVEVLSASNTENDRVTKFDLYEAHGVREYWIVNPDEDYIEVYSLESHVYRRVGAFKPGQVFQSPLLEQAISVRDLF